MSETTVGLDVNISSKSSSVGIIASAAQFWIVIIFLIPSFICALFVLYHLLFDSTLRRSLNNHVIIILLCTVLIGEVTNYPWMLYYYLNRATWQRSYVFCNIWTFIDWAFYMLQLLLFAWASIERHILIFNDRWVSTRKRRFFAHYLPPVIIITYLFIFYTFVYFSPSCHNIFDDTQMLCVKACLLDSFSFRAYDTLANNILPSVTIVVFSVTLLLRILGQKYRMHQPIRWRKHRKMTIQLLSISALYLFITIPWALIAFLRICGLPLHVGVSYETFTLFFSYFIVPLFPFVALISIPELRRKLQRFLQLRQQQRRVKAELVDPRNVRPAAPPIQ